MENVKTDNNKKTRDNSGDDDNNSENKKVLKLEDKVWSAERWEKFYNKKLDENYIKLLQSCQERSDYVKLPESCEDFLVDRIQHSINLLQKMQIVYLKNGEFYLLNKY